MHKQRRRHIYTHLTVLETPNLLFFLSRHRNTFLLPYGLGKTTFFLVDNEYLVYPIIQFFSLLCWSYHRFLLNSNYISFTLIFAWISLYWENLDNNVFLRKARNQYHSTVYIIIHYKIKSLSNSGINIRNIKQENTITLNLKWRHIEVIFGNDESDVT